jgi:hypothetical protein
MRRIRCLVLAGVVLAGLASTGAALAKNPLTAGNPEENEKNLQVAQRDWGWRAFQDWERVGNFVLVILGAAALGAILAFHPFSTHKASIEDLEQPKIMILYTVIGALVGIVVTPVPAVGLAIFGIGGLMRFRTELSAAKETGRVILATILGIACGLELWMVAIITTVVAWILIYILESRVNLRLVVRGVRSDTITQTAEAYAKILKGMKCTFGAPRKNPSKGQVSFNLQHRRGLTHEEIEAKCAEIAKEVRGTIDWPED